MSTTTTNRIVQPYLSFDGKCEEALEFYKRALDAEVITLLRFKDNPAPQAGCGQPGSENKVMHAQLRIGQTDVMASDGECAGKPNFDGFALSLAAPTEAEADKAFNALANGGKVEMPLMKTFFSDRFGMVADRYGVRWMILVTPNSAN
jgi:PhnB protein